MKTELVEFTIREKLKMKQLCKCNIKRLNEWATQSNLDDYIKEDCKKEIKEVEEIIKKLDI